MQLSSDPDRKERSDGSAALVAPHRRSERVSAGVGSPGAAVHSSAPGRPGAPERPGRFGAIEERKTLSGDKGRSGIPP